MRERNIERYLSKCVKALGGKCSKMIPSYDAGIPDRLVMLYGKTYFVELKAPGKKPSKLQAHFLEQLKKQGYNTAVLDSYEAVDEFIKSVKP